MIAIQIPPFAYRLLSKQTLSEIVATSELSKSTVARISLLRSWDSVTVGAMNRFVMGCGFSLVNPPWARWQSLCENGISSARHLQVKDKDKPWQRGAKANRIKAIRKTLSK